MKKAFVAAIFAALLPLLTFCAKDEKPEESGIIGKKIVIKLSSDSSSFEKVISQDNFTSEINDLNLFIFDQEGRFSQHMYLPSIYSSPSITVNCDYISVYAVANWGSNMFGSDVMSDLQLEQKKILFNLPAELKNRRIFTGRCRNVYVYSGVIVPLEMKRSYSKLTVVLDKSSMDNNVSIDVTKIEIKNTPLKTSLFEDYKATTLYDIAQNGYSIENPILSDSHQSSQELILAENMQGELLPNNSNQTMKVLPEESGRLCTYAEISATYRSPQKTGSVKYRIFLGNNETTNFDIKRNTWYKLTIKLKGNTLNETSWRIEREGLSDLVQSLKISPELLNFTNLNEIFALTCTALPVSAADKRVSWLSSNPLIASVSESGTVTSNGYGDCKIFAYAKDGSGIKDSMRVSVVYSDPVKYITSISLSPSILNLTYGGETKTLTAWILPSDAANKTLLWRSSDNSIATVDQNGVVTPVNPGSCYVTAYSTDGSEKTASSVINVNYAECEGIEIIESYNAVTGVTIPAKSSITDHRRSTGVRGSSVYRVRAIPWNANQNIEANWSLESAGNNPSSIISLSNTSGLSTTVTAKDLINTLTNRGAIKLKANYAGYSSSTTIMVYESVPIKLSWGIWISSETGEEEYGIVPEYANHSFNHLPGYMPLISIIGRSGTEYWNPEPGIMWRDPNLPTDYSGYFNEFSVAIVNPYHQYNNQTNCYYSITF